MCNLGERMFSGDEADRFIKGISIVLSIIYLGVLINSAELLWSLFEDFSSIDLSILELLIPFILYPIGIIKFLNFQRNGWIILVVLLTYRGTGEMVSFLLDYSSSNRFIQDSVAGGMMHFLGLDNYLIHLILGVGIFSMVLLFNKSSIVEKFQVSKKSRLIAISFAIAPMVLIWLVFF